MRIQATELAGVRLIHTELHEDPRGWFGRVFDEKSFAEAGLSTHLPQHNISLTTKRGTLRGLHFQRPPGAESKVVRCVRGAAFDVVVDMRQDSPSFRRWERFTLDRPELGVFIPPGCAHGFQALEDDTLILYLMGDAYRPHQQAGVRFDDPELAIPWPIANPLLSDADRTRAPYDWSRDWSAA